MIFEVPLTDGGLYLEVRVYEDRETGPSVEDWRLLQSGKPCDPEPWLEKHLEAELAAFHTHPSSWLGAAYREALESREPYWAAG